MSKSSTQLPEPEISSLSIGYMRLTDSAPLIVAQELGLYKKYGLEVELKQQVSWANIRDKLSVGGLDAAHMLAPQLLMASTGMTGMRIPLVTGLVLSLNGNAITLSRALSDEINAHIASKKLSVDPTTTAQSFADLVKNNTSRKLTLATVHTFACHTLLLHRWLKLGGLDPHSDVRIIVLPPQQMVDSLAKGVIDGYCVGEPWNTIAVQHGIGSIISTGYEIWPNAQEKVLAVTESWHQKHPSTHLRLRLALMEAAEWLSEDMNRITTASTLASPNYLDLIPPMLSPSLTGEIVAKKGANAQLQPDFHLFFKQTAGFPWRDEAENLLMESTQAIGVDMDREFLTAIAQRAYRTDLYREASRYLDIDHPASDRKAKDALAH